MSDPMVLGGGSQKPIGVRKPLDPALIAQIAGKPPEQSGTGAVDGTPPSIARRIWARLTASWFPPQAPLVIAIPSDVGVRPVDYTPGFNLQIRPRPYEPLGFNQLRQMSVACELVRLAIETRKDQIASQKVSFRLRKDPDEPAASYQERNSTDDRIDYLEQFFTKPDGRFRFSAWLRQLIEDLLVCDAMVVYPRKSVAGRPWALDVIDPALVTIKIDEDGRLPDPPGVAYQHVLKGQAAKDLTKDDLIYDIRNPRTGKFYGFSPVEQVIMTASTALFRSVAQMNFYKEGNMPEGLIEAPQGWTPDQIKQFQNWFDEYFRGDLTSRAGLVLMPSGKVTFTKKDELKNEFDEWLARVISYAFSLPPTWAIKQLNRSTAEQSQTTAADEGLAPLSAHVEQFLTVEIVNGAFGWSDVEAFFETRESVDPVQQANIDRIYTAAGIRTIDEVRVERGWDPLGIPAGIMTPSGFQQIPTSAVPEMESGTEVVKLSRRGDLRKKARRAY